MEHEKAKKRLPKAKITRKRKVPSKTSVTFSGKSSSAATASADVPVASSVWATAAPTDDNLEGNAAQSRDETGQSDSTTQMTRPHVRRSDAMFRASRPRTRHARHREHHASTRDRKGLQESSPEAPRPKRLQVTRDTESGPRAAPEAGQRSTQPSAFDMKPQAEAAVEATQTGDGQVVTWAGGGKQNAAPLQHVSVLSGGERRERAIVSQVTSKSEANKARELDSAAACNQFDLSRPDNPVCKGAAVPSSIQRKKSTTVAPSTKLQTGSSTTSDVCANDSAPPGPAQEANGDATPPCNPRFQPRWKTAPRTSTTKNASQPRHRDGTARASQDAVTETSEEDYYGDLYPDTCPELTTIKSGATDRTTTPFSEVTMSFEQSKPCRSLGQSWISQVAREMTGCASPHRNAIFALLKQELTRRPPAGVSTEVASPSISWASEHSDEQVNEPVASKGAALPDARLQSQCKTPETAGENKSGRGANSARQNADGMSSAMQDPRRKTLWQQPIAKQTPRFSPRDSDSRASDSRVDARQILFPVIVISVLILLAFVIAFLVPLKRSHFKTRLLNRLAAACRGDPACVHAVGVMASSLDVAADPCLEFDRFACGNWRAADPQRRSYRRESAQSYTRNIREALLRVLTHAPGASRGRGMDDSGGVRNMAAFYSSCQTFAEARDTAQVTAASDVISAMNLDRGTAAHGSVTARRDLQSLLQFVVGSSFKTGLPTFVSVTLKGDETFVDIGETLNSTLGPSRFVEEVLRTALRSLGAADDNETVDALCRADSSASDWRSRVSKSDPFNITRLKYLQPPFPGASWTDALNQGLAWNGSKYSPDSVLHARGMTEVSKIMTVLSEDNLTAEHGRAYASAVLLAQVMKYDYLFRGEGAYDRTAAPEGVDPCLEITGTYFKDLFPHWVATALVSNDRMRAFKNMAENLQSTVLHRSMSMTINGSEFSKLNFTITGESGLTSRIQRPRVVSSPSNYGDHFLLNVVLASRDHVGVDYEEGAVHRQLSGELSFFQVGEQQFVAVPASFLVAETLVANAHVPSLYYASVGVRLLLEWLEWILAAAGTPTTGHAVARAVEQVIGGARDWASIVFGSHVTHLERPGLDEWALNVTSAVAEANVSGGAGTTDQSLAGGNSDRPLDGSVDQRIQCVRDAASTVFGRAVSPEEGRLLVLADWALDVASTGAEAQRRRMNGTGASHEESDFVDDDSAELRISRQFFYLRFCHTLCGEDGPLAGACRYRTARSRDFARAFRCPDPPTQPSC
ncbi:uncharacterized protein [Dermacentor albipictus]|uniref:uncharacterized protein n=1 Tax=Dermacentor albipictus TaxID=60249 RepID=UPI0038FC37F0